ncbi:hypothetical protein F9U64_04205 [Gracilibacillus oryzae]|uniref:Uncharacterized protein n=1 Tax=Gracilibacillus oryzae TaxID=1672701 RepID=A0A7C8KUF2_9BACI|nr:hypothetical protein [Gracilibacillus oryzae]KAB8138828.1 hypothetical protein F9U64_04205 [Gracilibacillus oryzae]
MDNLKIIKENLHNWQSFEDLPPYTEIELLRIMDHYEKELLQSDSGTEAIIYAMLIFYRLKRKVTDDHLNELLQNSDEMSHPIVQEIQTLKHFFHVYQSLDDTDFSQFSIRETDFAPVKLKKVRALITELERMTELKGRHALSKSKLNDAYQLIFQQVEKVEDIAEGFAYALEQKKSIQDISV